MSAKIDHARETLSVRLRQPFKVFLECFRAPAPYIRDRFDRIRTFADTVVEAARPHRTEKHIFRAGDMRRQIERCLRNRIRPISRLALRNGRNDFLGHFVLSLKKRQIELKDRERLVGL